MARQQQKPLTLKQQAVRDLEDARASLANHATLAADEWSPRAVVARSMERHRALWIGGAALAGLVLMKLVWPAGNANIKRDNIIADAKNRGLFALLLSPLVALGRKTVLSYGAQLFETFLRQKVSPNESDAGTV